MKKVLSFFILSLLSIAIYATEQTPDYLLYKGNKLTLYTGWGHPSPLQTYFQQKEIKYPFKAFSTANYRGHIATWEIENNKFLLKEIKVSDDIYKPDKYNINSKSDTLISDGKVYADWFSGVLQCSFEKESYYFYVKNGEIVDKQIISEKDYEKIRDITEKDTADHVLMRKYAMLILNQNYISYYFRLSSEDQISDGDENGRFTSKRGFSPILGLFDNDHTKWPYNWENLGMSGAPNCNWVIDDKKIYLTKIGMQTGTGFYEVTRFDVPLEELFTTEVNDNRVFADWLSGIYIIQHGEEKVDPLLPGFKEFKIENISYIRVLCGLIIEKYTVPADYIKNGIPEDIDPDLKKIFEELE